MWKFKKFILAVFLLMGIVVKGQDPQFSQFYATSLNLNPAFTGNTDGGRLSSVYRNQWAAVPGAFVSYAVAYDHNLSEMNSGVGFMVTHDKAGSGGLKYTNLAGLYSYVFQLDHKVFVRTGLNLSYTFRGIDKARLLFADQIIRDNASETVENFADYSVSYLDVSSGALLYSDKYWVGTSFSHVNRPLQSLIYGEAQLPVRASLHGGYKFVLEDKVISDNESSITAAFNYKHQLRWNQLDIGAYYINKFYVLGIWYRGIPFFKSFDDNFNYDAVVLLAGIQTKQLSIGYSYDITVSKLFGNTNGSHEITLVYEFPPQKRKKKKMSFVPCAKF